MWVYKLSFDLFPHGQLQKVGVNLTGLKRIRIDWGESPILFSLVTSGKSLGNFWKTETTVWVISHFSPESFSGIYHTTLSMMMTWGIIWEHSCSSFPLLSALYIGGFLINFASQVFHNLEFNRSEPCTGAHPTKAFLILATDSVLICYLCFNWLWLECVYIIDGKCTNKHFVNTLPGAGLEPTPFELWVRVSTTPPSSHCLHLTYFIICVCSHKKVSSLIFDRVMGIWSCTIEKVDFEKNAFKVLKCPFS